MWDPGKPVIMGGKRDKVPNFSLREFRRALVGTDSHASPVIDVI